MRQERSILALPFIISLAGIADRGTGEDLDSLGIGRSGPGHQREEQRS